MAHFWRRRDRVIKNYQTRKSHRRRGGDGFRMTVANLLGIPLGTYLSQEFSWRYTFLLIAVFNIAVMASVYFWVPDIRDEAKGKLREQFHFLRSPAPWLIFAATMFGNAGVFTGSAT